MPGRNAACLPERGMAGVGCRSQGGRRGVHSKLQQERVQQETSVRTSLPCFSEEFPAELFGIPSRHCVFFNHLGGSFVSVSAARFPQKQNGR
jgi:hypothetical protein